MKVEGVNNFINFNFENFKVNRPMEVLSREEVEFFEKLFPESVDEIKRYYDSQGREVYEKGQIINKRV